MPISIIPDIDIQRCIGCALCVEICTSLGPDVLRVNAVEGWKRGKAFVFYPERCISDGACIGVCPTKAIFWMRPMSYTPGQPVPPHNNGVFVKGWLEDITVSRTLETYGKTQVINTVSSIYQDRLIMESLSKFKTKIGRGEFFDNVTLKGILNLDRDMMTDSLSSDQTVIHDEIYKLIKGHFRNKLNYGGNDDNLLNYIMKRRYLSNKQASDPEKIAFTKLAMRIAERIDMKDLSFDLSKIRKRN